MKRYIFCVSDSQRKLEEYRKLLSLHNVDVIQLSKDKLKYVHPLLPNRCIGIFKENGYLTDTANKYVDFSLWKNNKYSSIQEVIFHSKLIMFKTTFNENQYNIADKFYRNLNYKILFEGNNKYISFYEKLINTLPDNIKDIYNDINTFKIEVAMRYKEIMEGYIVPKHRYEKEVEDGFGWDWFFYKKDTNISLYDISKNGFCKSPRDINLSRVIKKYLYYEIPIKWNHDTNNMQNKVVDFSIDPLDKMDCMIPKTKYSKLLMDKVINTVLNNGIFTKLSKNFRQKISWKPGGNAGLPETPKSTKTHELVYWVHDIFHQLIYDPIYTGNDSSLEEKEWIINLYTVVRTMSECITLVMADMLFVHCILMDGLQYETVDDRKIYPFFKSMIGRYFDRSLYTSDDIDKHMTLLLSTSFIKKLITASVRYGMMGDDKGFEEYANDFISVLGYDDRFDIKSNVYYTEFRKKYDSFLWQDLIWSKNNIKWMTDHKQRFSSWYSDYNQDIKSMNFYTLDELSSYILHDMRGSYKTSNYIKYDNIVMKIFDFIWEKYLDKQLSDNTQVLNCFEDRRKISFKKWAIDQLLFCNTYQELYPNIGNFWKPLLKQEYDRHNIDNFRYIYKSMLDYSFSRKIITEDDRITFNDLYPIVQPFTVSYDYIESSFNNKLKDFSNDLCISIYKFISNCDNKLKIYWNNDIINSKINSVTSYEKILDFMKADYNKDLKILKEPYVKIVNKTTTDKDIIKLYDILGIDKEQEEFYKDSEFCARLTYLSFTNKSNLLDYHNNMIHNLKHLSPYAHIMVSILIVGTVETLFEIVSHSELRISRLTSSNTKAMDNCYYQDFEDINICYLSKLDKDIISNELSKNDFNNHGLKINHNKRVSEIYNMLKPSNKCGALVATGSLKDWRKIISSRSDEYGNETDIRIIVKKIKDILQSEFPNFF